MNVTFDASDLPEDLSANMSNAKPIMEHYASEMACPREIVEPEPMIDVALHITFETYRPISQRLGVEFWSMGSHFTAVTGSARYELKSRGQAQSLPDAVDGICAQISQLIEASYPEWPPVKFLKILALDSDIRLGNVK